MLHPDDAERVLNFLRIDDGTVPEKVEREYDLLREVYVRMGGSGPLGPAMLASMLRGLKVAPPPKPKSTVILDWRAHVGKPIVAKYGDQDLPGTLVDVVDVMTVKVQLDGVPGEVEMGRGWVRLPD